MNSAIQDISVDNPDPALKDASTDHKAHSDMLGAIASLDSAFAVVCYQSDTVLLVSNGLQVLMPLLKKGVHGGTVLHGIQSC